MSLILKRKLGERIVINHETVIELIKVDRGNVRLRIWAQNEVPVDRTEVYELKFPGKLQHVYEKLGITDESSGETETPTETIDPQDISYNESSSRGSSSSSDTETDARDGSESSAGTDLVE